MQHTCLENLIVLQPLMDPDGSLSVTNDGSLEFIGKPGFRRLLVIMDFLINVGVKDF